MKNKKKNTKTHKTYTFVPMTVLRPNGEAMMTSDM